jgi:hypothetical protein
MKSFSIILLCSIVFLCLVQVGAAVTGSNIQTSPTQLNALKPGDVISEVSGVINLPTSGSETFNSDDSVEFYTQLDNAKWSISIVIGGIENPARTYGGKHATIGGYDLSYPTSGYSSVALKFSMTGGTVPSSFTSGTITLVRVIETDPDSNQVGAAVNINGTVINTASLQTQIDSAKVKLATLKADIDAKAALGVDTTLPLQDYNAASDSLDTAAFKITSSPSEVDALITSATGKIDEGTAALDQADADFSIKQAQAMIDSVNGLITEFRVNDSLKDSDPRLVPIINKYDLAARALSDAKNSFTQGSYTSVRSDASQSLGYANQAWNLSLDLKTELSKGFSLPLPNLSAFLPVLVVVAVVLIVAGVIIYRRKMHWDELG